MLILRTFLHKFSYKVKVMLHDTIRKDDLYHITALQLCLNCSSIATMCCAKNGSYESFRVTSTLLIKD